MMKYIPIFPSLFFSIALPMGAAICYYSYTNAAPKHTPATVPIPTSAPSVPTSSPAPPKEGNLFHRIYIFLIYAVAAQSSRNAWGMFCYYVIAILLYLLYIYNVLSTVLKFIIFDIYE